MKNPNLTLEKNRNISYFTNIVKSIKSAFHLYKLILIILIAPMMSFGQNNYSMNFDGVNDYIELTDIDLLQDFTISAWINTNNIGSYQNIVSKYVNSPQPGGYALIVRSTGEFYAHTGLGVTPTTFCITNTLANVNQWNHISLVLNGGLLSFYLNGQFIYSCNGLNNSPNTTSNTFIGKAAHGLTELFDGLIDNVEIWNTALTQQEIQQYMNCPPTGTETDLVGYWNFEEGSGTTAFDLTSNGNNGTINGATYSTDVPLQNCCVPTSSTDLITACDSYTWVDGNTYTASNNTATYTTTNAAGCDSIITLDLTINNSSSSTDVITAYNDYTWLDGNTYTASNNTATFTTSNAVGCDSIITLDLTIIYTKLYWVGNDGDWTNPSNWSNQSGGSPINQIPTNQDSVYFDNNSFNSSNQIVNVDDTAYLNYMDWTGINSPQTLFLERNLMVYGDIVLNSNLNVRRDTSQSFIFKDNASITSNNSNIDANFIVSPNSNSQTLKLEDNLMMSDTSGILIVNGIFDTQNNDVKTGAISTINDISSTTDSRTLNMGSSFVELKGRFNSDGDDDLTINPGTSHLYIGDTVQYSPDTISVLNFLMTEGSASNPTTFYDVTLNFQTLKNLDQRIIGNNSFNKLTIVPGSSILFESGATQTISDSLKMIGNCRDSIHIYSQIPFGSPGSSPNSFLQNDGSTNAECLKIDNIVVSNSANAYFSSNLSSPGTNNWVFNSTPAVTSSFTADGPFCFGDTTGFTNNSVNFLGTTSDITSQWYFNDGSTGYFDPAGVTCQYSIIMSDSVGDGWNGWSYDIIQNGITLSTFSLSTGASDTTFVTLEEGVNCQIELNTVGVDSLGSDISFSIVTPIDIEVFSLIGASGSSGDIVASLNPSCGSDYINYEQDTSSHVFIEYGSIDVVLKSEYKNYCTSYDTVTVDIINPNFSLSSSVLDTNICPGTSVDFEAQSPNSATQFEFFYNGVSQGGPSVNDTLLSFSSLNNNDVISLKAYENGCESDTMPSYTFNVFNYPSFSFEADDLDADICVNDLVNFQAFNTDSSNQYQFFINGVAYSQFQDSIGLFSTSILSDEDTVSVVAIDQIGCSDTSSIIFNVNNLPTPTLSSSIQGNVICQDETVIFTGSGAYEYEFYLNGIIQQPFSTTSTWTTNSLSFQDTVTLVGRNISGCLGDAVESFSYFINPIPNTTLTSSDADSSICSGDEVIFSASGAVLYEFFVNGVSQGASSPTSTITINNLSNNDVVYVQGFTSGGCNLNSSSIIMEVLTSPNTSLTSSDLDNTICYGENVTFTSSGANEYEFFIDGISQGTPSTNNTFNTDQLINGQVVSVNGISNTCIVSQQSNWTVLINPSVSLFSTSPSNSICIGDPITFTGSNASQYEFLVNGTSVQGPSSNSSLINPTFSAGTNQVQVIGTAGNGCSDSSSIILTNVNIIPTMILSSSDIDNVICSGDSVTFTGSGGDMYQFYLDGTPQGPLSSTNTFTTSSLSSGQVVSLGGQLLGCPGVTSNLITTTVNPLPSVILNASDNVFCIDELITFSASGANNYEFFVDGTSQGPISSNNTINSSGFIAGTYPISVNGEANGCENNSTISITVNSLPTAAITSSTSDTICSGSSIVFTASGGALYEFFINNISQGPSTTSNVFNTNNLISGSIVSVEITDIQGCNNIDSTNQIIVNPTPNTILSSSDIDNQFCNGDTITFSGSGANEYEFFINGISQGIPSLNSTLVSSSISNGDNIQVLGTSLGCSSYSSVITNSVFGIPIVNLINNDDNEICDGELTNLLASGANNYQFFINGIYQSSSNPFNSIVNDGDQVTVLGQANGCESFALDTISYTVYNYPVLVSSCSDIDNIICVDDNISFSASGGMSYEFLLNGISQYFGNNNSFSTDELEDNDIISIITYNGDCPSNIDTYNFTVNSMPLSLSVTPSNMICEGESVTFTASGGDNYEFLLNGNIVQPLSPNNTYNSSTLNDLDIISFIGESTSTNCLQTYDDYIIMDVISQPIISATSSTTFCEGDSVMIISNSLFGNQWLLNNNIINGDNDTAITIYDSGSYSLEVTTGGNGKVWSFGQNSSGVFANGSNLNNSEPTPSSSSLIFNEISSGYDFLLAIDNQNEVYSWGENSSGQLGDGTYTNANEAQIVPSLSNIKTIATSESASMAVDYNGDVWVWGNNTEGQLGIGNTAVVNFPLQNTNLSNVDSIAGGKNHFIILYNNGTVAAVGNNDFGQLGQDNLTSYDLPSLINNISNITHIGAGEYHSFAIDDNENLFVWGNNSSGQLGLNDLDNRLVPTLSSLKKVVDCQGGAAHSVFLTSEDEVFVSGNNTYGQLGNGTFSDEISPVKIDIQGAKSISVSQYTTLVQRNDNSVFGFGNNTEEQLSSTNGNLINSPEHISDLNGVTFIEGSKSSSHFIYGNSINCLSNPIVTLMESSPTVTISENNNVLTTIAGDSYQWFFNGNPIAGGNNQSQAANVSGNYSVEVTFANGCVGLSDIYFHGMASIEENPFGEIILYPNPSRELLHVKIINPKNKNITISILDQTGRIIKTISNYYVEEIHLNISELNSGIYYLDIKDNHKNKKTLRFIKSD